MSAATLGLEWTKTSLTSVRTSLQTETDAVMKAVNSVCGEREKGDIALLHRRGMMLRDQHRLLLSLFKRFKSQWKRIQQIYDGNDDQWLSEVDAEDVLLRLRCEKTGTSLQPTASETGHHRKRLRVGDDTAVSKSDTVSTHSQQIFVTSASLQCLDKDISEADVISSTVGEMTGGVSDAVSEALDHTADDDVNCLQSQSPRSADHSQLSSTCQQNGALFSRPARSSLVPAVSRSHGHAVMVTYSHTDVTSCLLYTSPRPRDRTRSRMPSSA